MHQDLSPCQALEAPSAPPLVPYPPNSLRNLLKRKERKEKLTKPCFLLDTDDRPYICVLCQRTFTRGDTLKRHFDKCAIRRGNPTGASHLSDPKAYLNNRPETQQVPAFGRSNQIDKTGSGTESTGFDSPEARNMPAAENGVLTYPHFRPNEQLVFKWDMHSLIPPGGQPIATNKRR